MSSRAPSFEIGHAERFLANVDTSSIFGSSGTNVRRPKSHQTLEMSGSSVTISSGAVPVAPDVVSRLQALAEKAREDLGDSKKEGRACAARAGITVLTNRPLAAGLQTLLALHRWAQRFNYERLVFCSFCFGNDVISSWLRKKVAPSQKMRILRQGIYRFEEACHNKSAGLKINGIHIRGTTRKMAKASISVTASQSPGRRFLEGTLAIHPAFAQLMQNERGVKRRVPVSG
jgi:hypothetical protein